MAPRTIILIGLALAFLVVPSTTTFFADWLWFDEVGYRPVFVKALTARTLIGSGVFVLTFLWLAANLRHALNAASGAPSSFTTREGFTIVLPTRDQLRPLAMLAAAAAALLVALFASSEWMTLLQWWHQTPFPAVDPILGTTPRSTSSRCRCSSWFVEWGWHWWLWRRSAQRPSTGSPANWR